MTLPEPKIEVVAHGPYEVTGGPTLRPRRVVRSERGEALTWKVGDGLPCEGTYYLCRCGQSQDKPFCDGSHGFVLFEGTETASVTASEDRAEVHDAEGIRVLKDTELCHHAQFCKYADTNWFEMLRSTGDTSVRSQLVAMVERCPSGSLSYEIDGERIEPNLPVEIAPVENGPLFVSGRILIERADGKPMEIRNRVALCRCGQSKNKPLCDGTHADIGFEA